MAEIHLLFSFCTVHADDIFLNSLFVINELFSSLPPRFFPSHILQDAETHRFSRSQIVQAS